MKLNAFRRFLVGLILHRTGTMASWISFEKLRVYGLDTEPMLQSQYMWVSLLVLVVPSFSIRQSKSGNESIDAPIIGSAQSWIAKIEILL